MPSPNQDILHPQFGALNPGSLINFATNNPVPVSSIESTMFWLDRIAEQHDWVNRRPDSVIGTSGFWWKRHNGLELELFTPNSGKPYRLLGYPNCQTTFWENFRDVIKYVGTRTLRWYENYGGYVSGILALGLNESGWTWGQGQEQWNPYGSYLNADASMNLITSGIVDLSVASKSQYMGVPGKLDYQDYLQYVNVSKASQTASLDYFQVTASKSFSKYKAYFGLFIPSGTLPTPLQAVATRDYKPSILDGTADGGGLFNEGTVTYHSGFLLDGTPGYREHDRQITTANNRYTQADFTALCNQLIIDTSGNTSGWIFSDSSDRLCEFSFLKDYRMAVYEKAGRFHYDYDEDSWQLLGPLNILQEHYKIKANIDVKIPMTFIYLNREVQEPNSGDYRFDDYNHYLREFTGFTPNDTLDVRSQVSQYNSNYSNSFYRPVIYETIPPFSNNYTYAFSGYPLDTVWNCSGHQEGSINITSNGDIKLIAGFVNYDPYERFSFPSSVPFIPQTASADYISYYRRNLGQKALNKIYSNDYLTLGTFPITSGDVNFEIGLQASIEGIIRAWSFGFMIYDDIQYNSYISNLGKISGIVDLEPPSNTLFFALLAGNVDISGQILSNNTIPSLTWGGFTNYVPEDYPPNYDEESIRIIKAELIRTKATFDSNLNAVGAPQTDSLHTSYYAVPSGQRKIDHELSSLLTVAANTRLYNSHL